MTVFLLSHLFHKIQYQVGFFYRNYVKKYLLAKQKGYLWKVIMLISSVLQPW